MKAELYNYDIYPKVFLAGREREITVQPLGWHAGFEAGKTCEVTVCATEAGSPRDYPEWASFRTLEVVPSEDGCLRFTCDFPSEQEYFVRIRRLPEEKPVQLNVYALDEDMAGRYPFRGDMHMHSRRSDGREAPEIVCANYRAAGYDFMALTDHSRYYPSLEAIRAYEKLDLDFSLIPGEEVHLPFTDVHIVNVGGLYSVNGLVEGQAQLTEKGDDPKWRSLNGDCPPVLSKAEYETEIRTLAENSPLDCESARLSYAVCQWAFARIREADGLGVFPHPYWISDVYQVPEKLLGVLMQEKPFDAFEVLGGENYFEHNGFQAIRYYEERARGNNFPIVGSTDTHGSTEHNRNGFICSTIVFAPDAGRESLIAAIKDYFSIAVDTISEEFRLVGELRLAKYACFLMKNYFPLHDRLCAIEGELMRQYATGDPKAADRLAACRDMLPDMRKKYFAMEKK